MTHEFRCNYRLANQHAQKALIRSYKTWRSIHTGLRKFNITSQSKASENILEDPARTASGRKCVSVELSREAKCATYIHHMLFFNQYLSHFSPIQSGRARYKKNRLIRLIQLTLNQRLIVLYLIFSFSILKIFDVKNFRKLKHNQTTNISRMCSEIYFISPELWL